MVFIVAIWSIVLLVWLALAAYRFNWSGKQFPLVLCGLAVLVSGSVFGYDFFHIPAPIPITADRALLGLIVMTFGILVVREKAYLRELVATDYLAGGLLVVLLGSALLTDSGYFKNLPLSRFIFFYLLPFGLYFVVKHAKFTDRELKLVAIGFCGFCVYLALTAVAESRGWYGIVFPSYIRDPKVTEFLGRGRGPFLNPISNGIFLTTGLAMAVMLWKLARNNLFEKAVWTLAIPVLFVGNICTLTRSVWMGMILAVGLIVLFITTRRQKAVLIVTGTVGAVLLFAVLGSSLINFKRDKHVSKNEMSQSAQLRPIFASIAWEMIQDRPFFGCGFGQYNKHKRRYMQDPHSDLQLSKGAPYLQHNVVLSLVTEVGLIGVGLFLMLLVRAGQEAAMLVRWPDATPWTRAYGLVMLAMLISYFINGMFHDVSIIPMANSLLFFLLAIIVGTRYTYRKDKKAYISIGRSWAPGIRRRLLIAPTGPR